MNDRGYRLTCMAGGLKLFVFFGGGFVSGTYTSEIELQVTETSETEAFFRFSQYLSQYLFFEHRSQGGSDTIYLGRAETISSFPKPGQGNVSTRAQPCHVRLIPSDSERVIVPVEGGAS